MGLTSGAGISVREGSKRWGAGGERNVREEKKFDINKNLISNRPDTVDSFWCYFINLPDQQLKTLVKNGKWGSG